MSDDSGRRWRWSRSRRGRRMLAVFFVTVIIALVIVLLAPELRKAW